MIKVGKYTAALILVVVGSLLLVDLTTDTEIVDELINWWPAVIILLGVEYLLLSAIYRDPDKKIGFAIGSLILSIVLSIVVIGYTSFPNFNFASFDLGDFSFTDKSGKSYDKGTTVVPINDNHNKVSILNPNGDIEIKAGDVAEIQIATILYVSKLKSDESDGIAEASTVEYADHGSDTIEVEAKGKEYRIFGIKQKPRMDMIITIPSGQEVDYEIDMTNGKFLADGIAVKEMFVVKTTNGGITISDIQGKVIANTTNGKMLVENILGDVELDTTNGTITANDVDGDLFANTTNGKIIASGVSGNVEADSTNGAIALTEVHEDVVADTTNGGITVRTASLGGDWELETKNGNIEVYLPQNADFEMDGDASRNDTIRSDFPLEISKGEVSGRVGSGKYEISMETNNGINIYENR